MSWPTWSTAAAPIPTAVAGAVQSTLLPTAINSAPTVLTPMGYSQDQWAQAQQQNWQQWAQWQQQYQQWHQQYGAEYQKSLNAMQGALPPAGTLPPVGTLPPTVQVQPPLPAISTTLAPPLPIENKPPLPPEEPPVQHTVGFTAGYATAAPALVAQSTMPQLYQVQPTQHTWQTTSQKRPYTQDGDYNDPAKRMMVQKPPQTQWQGGIPNYSQPPPLAATTQAPPPVQSTTPAKANVEELSEAEKKFDKEFAAWEAQFNKWKEQNANHPDKTQYKEYEKKWESWRNSLLERREQMRRKRLALGSQTAANSTPQKAETLQEVPSNASQKPALLGAYPGAKPANDFFNKPPPNHNNEPLNFKSKPSYPEINDIPEKEGAGFLTSTSSAEGIPGLDLVKDDTKEDLPDRSEKKEKIEQIIEDDPPSSKGPDFEAISKGINTILGDQKLLSMLSMVSQKAPPLISKDITTESSPSPNISNIGQNYGIPPPNFQQYPPNYNAPPPVFEGQNTDYSTQVLNKSNKDDYYQRLDKFDAPPPDIRRNPQDTFSGATQNSLDIHGSASRSSKDSYRQDFGGQNDYGFNGRNPQDNYGNAPPSFGGRNNSFDANVDRFNHNDHFDDKFHNERFSRDDNFNNGNFNNKQNNFSNRDRFNDRYDNYNDGDDYDEQEDYDKYNEDDDYDKYNDMFKDEDDEQYECQQQNRFQPLQQQVKIPSLMDINPEPIKQLQPPVKIPSLLDMAPEPPQIRPIVPAIEDDVIFEPTTVIDYGHCSKEEVSGEHSVAVVPINMYDYNHKPVNSVPHSARPAWLAEAVKFIREFDPSVLRYDRTPTTPIIDNRYPPIIRDEVPYDRFEERDRYRIMRNRRERSFEKDNFYKEKERTSIDSRNRYGTRDRIKDDFKREDVASLRKFDKEGSFRDTLIQNVEEISDSEMDFEQNEQARHSLEIDSRRSLSPELSNPPNPTARKMEITMIEDIINAPGRYNRPPRIVIILRGPPGSGKTFLAKQIKDKEVENGGSAPRILSLDDYFMVDQEKQVVEDGKTQTVKEMVYEYEADMEESYRQSFMKSFKKTITDGYFTFIVVDNVNDKVKHFGEMWSFAKQNGFQAHHWSDSRLFHTDLLIELTTLFVRFDIYVYLHKSIPFFTTTFALFLFIILFTFAISYCVWT